jgi:foldase protein PrsA
MLHNAEDRRRRPFALLATLLALVATAAGLTACGDNVPGNAVARVGDETIERETFDHWMRIAAIQARGPATGNQAPKVEIPQPPDFEKCVADKKRTEPKPPKGQPQKTDQQFKDACKQEYEGLRDQVLALLIQAEWLQGEAEDQGVKVSEGDVRKNFEQQKKQAFPKEADYKRFLKTSGFTEQDALFQVRLSVIQNKLREKILKGKDKVTDQAIQRYYDKNKKRFSQPERRDLRVVLTRTEAKADEAKRAIQGGQAFSAVARKYSIDETSKRDGGALKGVAKDQQEPAFDKAVFAAEKGELVGPVKTQFGWYVFKVQKITPAIQQTLEQSKATIRGLLRNQQQQDALKKFEENFKKKWREETTCREGFQEKESCGNAPEPKTDTSTAPPGAVPQPGGGQAPPGGGQQVPPGAEQVPPPQGGGQQVPPGAEQVPPPQGGGQGGPPGGQPPQP